MGRVNVSKAALAAWIAATVAGAVLPALAGSTGNGTAGGGFSQYTFEADANRLCKGDTVVWGSGDHKGIYFVKGHGPYLPSGQRYAGFYACSADVKKAGYKIE